jgi:hypothetical protein
MKRREFAKTIAYGAIGLAGLYAFSKIPMVSAQSTQVSEIDVGPLQVPVTFDGQVRKDEWYSDSIDYQSTDQAIIGSPSTLPHFHFRAKYDSNYTYLAFDILNAGRGFNLYQAFDTKNIRSNNPRAAGVYSLDLNPISGTSEQGEWTEVDNDPASTSGTDLYKLFKKGQDMIGRVMSVRLP